MERRKTGPDRIKRTHRTPEGTVAGASGSGIEETIGKPDREDLLNKIEESSKAVQRADYKTAITLYTQALTLDATNHILYSNRSAAFLQLGLPEKALIDARKARKLQPTWGKAFYREGISLQCLGQEAESLAAFAAGLAQEPKNTLLLSSMVDAALKSQLKDKFQPIYTQLHKMDLHQSPFVISSVIGQELLSMGDFAHAVTVLESALHIGTSSQKLRGSVFSALASAHWGLGSIDKAIACMQEDLAVAALLGDQEGESRAYGNLGSAFFCKGNFHEALKNHRYQLVLAMKLKCRETAASALTSLGHVYTAVSDYPNALASHKQCVLLVKQTKNQLAEAREIGNVGCVYLAMGEYDSAVECHMEHLSIARKLHNKVEEARAYSNLGSVYHCKREFLKAEEYHKKVLKIGESARNKTLEARAYAGLGHATRNSGNIGQSKFYHERQLDVALQTKDRLSEGRACTNLGIVFQLFGDFEAALKLHKAHLNIAKTLGDRASQGRAYGNIGNAYSAMGRYELAVRFHKQELAISREVNDKQSETSTHGNLAVAYQELKLDEKALHHYELHYKLAKELKNLSSEARAVSNLGNFYSAKRLFSEALPFYEQFLELSQELQDSESEARACHKLGYAHFCLKNYKEAIRYYEQDLSVAKQSQEKLSMARAYCNLGLAHKAMGDPQQALECQRQFLTLSISAKNIAAKFKALGNLGDIYLKLENLEEASKMYNQQLELSKGMNDKRNEALALRNQGCLYKHMKEYDKALGFHNQELTLWQELVDVKGECVCHCFLGNIHMTLKSYSNAVHCYEEQLDRAREMYDSLRESQAYCNLGLAKMNMGLYDDAIGQFEQQLAMLEQHGCDEVMRDKGQAYGNLGDCYEALQDYDEAIKCYDQYLAMAQSCEDTEDQGKAYQRLGDAHRAMGNLQHALVCFEKRLVVTHELDEISRKASAYGDLGCVHTLLGNFEQAISCLENQMQLSREIKDTKSEADAACGLGGVHQQMGEPEKAIQFHKVDMKIATDLKNQKNMCRAYGNLGLSHESLGEYERAVEYQEQHLSLAAEMQDKEAKTLALCSLGRIYHALGKYTKSIQYLQQGLLLAEHLGYKEEEAKIRHRLGLALWGQGQLNDSKQQLYRAAELFELIRRSAQNNSEYKLSLFDLQTACYQALQRVLVAMGHHEEALVVAERGRTRAFVDLLLERQSREESWFSGLDSSPVTLDQLLHITDKQRAIVLYYSLAAGHLYTWLISPAQGVLKFHQRSIADMENNSDTEDIQSLHSLNMSSVSVIDQFVGGVRETLGVEFHTPSASSSRLGSSRTASLLSETESQVDDMWQQHLEEVGDKLNAENDRVGFLRMVNRNHILNASSYSLNSMLSFSSSLSGVGLSRVGSTRTIGSNQSGQPPLSALYELLIQPMEAMLDVGTEKRDLVLVLQGDLYLVPFALLRPCQQSPCLFDRFNLLVVPSIRALQTSQTLGKKNRYNPNCSGTVVVGNPKLPPSVTRHWDWHDLPSAEHEGKFLSDLLGCSPIMGSTATKDNVLHRMRKAEVIHFATHISWKLAAVVLSPVSMATTSHTNIQGRKVECMELDSSCSSDLGGSVDGPSLSEFLLTAADVLHVKISAKLVVLSSVHSEDRAGRINADGVVGLTRAFLAAGAQCVLFSLWPVPAMAAKMLLKVFYTSLLQGAPCSQALSEAMRSIQATRQFSHPSNWAGWVLVGSNVYLSSRVALMGHALRELLHTPDQSREAMRVALHLMEKSLQRIHRGQRNAMYTTHASIQNKVGEAQGWRELLESVGFRFEPTANELPAAVFFPTADPGDRLTQCSASLQALLGLGVPTLTALSKLLSQPEAGETLCGILKDAITCSNHDSSLKIPINVRLWRVPGCHELLASIGFDLVDVGKDEVTIKAGKNASRRSMQFAYQALTAVFDTHEAPRALMIDSSSSLESLCSTGSATSTSNFSKGSSPPTSPNSSKCRSIFNPAEVDKLPSASKHRHQGGVTSKTVSTSKSMPDLTIQLSHLSTIRKKYCSASSDDNSAAEESGPCVISVEVHEPANQEDSSSDNPSPSPGQPSSRPRPRHSLFERGGVKGYFPQPIKLYSTSTSDSEEAAIERKQNIWQLSHSRSSLISNSSTLTARSTNSSVLRRNRARSSALSIRSSASEQTLIEEPQDSPHQQHRAKQTEVRQQEPNITEYSIPDQTPAPSVLQKHVSLNSGMNDTDGNGSGLTGNYSSSYGIKDPTAVAQMVLAETMNHRLALEEMQHKSLKGLREKQCLDRNEVDSTLIEEAEQYNSLDRAHNQVSDTSASNLYEMGNTDPGEDLNMKPSLPVVESIQDQIIKLQLERLSIRVSSPETANIPERESIHIHPQGHPDCPGPHVRPSKLSPRVRQGYVGKGTPCVRQDYMRNDAQCVRNDHMGNAAQCVRPDHMGNAAQCVRPDHMGNAAQCVRPDHMGNAAQCVRPDHMGNAAQCVKPDHMGNAAQCMRPDHMGNAAQCVRPDYLGNAAQCMRQDYIRSSSDVSDFLPKSSTSMGSASSAFSKVLFSKREQLTPPTGSVYTSQRAGDNADKQFNDISSKGDELQTVSETQARQSGPQGVSSGVTSSVVCEGQKSENIEGVLHGSSVPVDQQPLHGSDSPCRSNSVMSGCSQISSASSTLTVIQRLPTSNNHGDKNHLTSRQAHISSSAGKMKETYRNTVCSPHKGGLSRHSSPFTQANDLKDACNKISRGDVSHLSQAENREIEEGQFCSDHQEQGVGVPRQLMKRDFTNRQDDQIDKTSYWEQKDYMYQPSPTESSSSHQGTSTARQPIFKKGCTNSVNSNVSSVDCTNSTNYMKVSSVDSIIVKNTSANYRNDIPPRAIVLPQRYGETHVHRNAQEHKPDSTSQIVQQVTPQRQCPVPNYKGELPTSVHRRPAPLINKQTRIFQYSKC